MNRNIWVYLLLTVVTCGLFGLYWITLLNDDVNKLSNEEGPSGVMVVVLSLVTCGIYMLFWYYQMGRKLVAAQKAYGKEISSGFEFLFLILGVFGFGVIADMIMQDSINKILE